MRYADDYVVFCESKDDAEAAQHTLSEWLEVRGLALSPEKTRIVHLTEGFDFLGFTIKHYPAPKTSKSGYKLLIKPSQAAVTRLKEKLRAKWLAHNGINVLAVIAHLNPVIRGWANNYRGVVASETFQKLDDWMYIRQFRYAKRAHPQKSWGWRKAKYWGKLNLDREDKWVFGDKRSGAHLIKFKWFKIERHPLVTGTASPDDPALRDYWEWRAKRQRTNLYGLQATLAKRQKGFCPVCGESLYNDEELHVHHKIPRSEGGDNKRGNLVLVHLYCHHQIHGKKLPERVIQQVKQA